ncbi:universal stress protein [Herbidospora sp. NEAU-GS84]|uniref:Universal stress protein n=1 Tax=Herbidospora solisilvae TaxID=2696284 RepID=A0A7C9NE77_9ACTN|nr:universal stress protein [Herbidospora solisilvae]NAS20638.1 universal stress protein [Herbidospora solisilvae]
MKVVTVGVDGSPNSLAAVEWAADDAARRGAWLRVVHVVDRSPYRFVHSLELESQIAKVSGQIMTEAERTARHRRPGLGMRLEHIEGRPAEVLRRLAAESSGLVLGSRGMSRTAGGILGSVSTQVAGHATGPVVIVRDRPAERVGEVVIGLDDSADCQRPISYAFEQAALHHAEIRALHAWSLPGHSYAPEVDYDINAVRARQRAVAAGLLDRHRRRYPALPVVDDLRSAHPVEALVDASLRAGLLVVGSHGRSGSMVMGSVSRRVLRHAHCPIAVVRPCTRH